MPGVKTYVVTETREIIIRGGNEKAVLDLAINSFRENIALSSSDGATVAVKNPKTVETNIKVVN